MQSCINSHQSPAPRQRTSQRRSLLILPIREGSRTVPGPKVRDLAAVLAETSISAIVGKGPGRLGYLPPVHAAPAGPFLGVTRYTRRLLFRSQKIHFLPDEPPGRKRTAPGPLRRSCTSRTVSTLPPPFGSTRLRRGTGTLRRSCTRIASHPPTVPTGPRCCRGIGCRPGCSAEPFEPIGARSGS
jgi:hypothetical protein